MRDIWKARINNLLVLVPWFFILYQANVGLFTPADHNTARWFTFLMILISAIGSGIDVKPTSRKATYIFISLGLQLGVFLVFGSIGVLDATTTSYQASEGFLYSLDALGGFSSAVAGLDGIVGIIAKVLPLVVLIVGEIGIMLSDTPDELQTPLLETGISIALLAVFYGVGNLVGYI